MLNNLNSSLRFIVNNTYEIKNMKNGSVVLVSLNQLFDNIINQTVLQVIKLMTCFDSLIDDNGNEIQFTKINSTDAFTEEELNITANLESDYPETKEINPVGMDIYVPHMSQTTLDWIKTTFKVINISVTDSLTDSNYIVPITINFDYIKNPNAAKDFYTRSLMKNNDITYETEALAEFYYNKKGIKQDFINPQEPQIKVYVSSTKTVALWDEHVLVCTDGKFFNVVNQSCIPVCGSGTFRF
jgi:hypothetical protein